MADLISRQAAIDAIDVLKRNYPSSCFEDLCKAVDIAIKALSVEPEVKEIGYAECANAMLKMWIDNVLTDAEYNRIMDKLNARYNSGKRRTESEV